jgi:L,D-peptidoglycan transpeptidase YkuD (ErfK/YbiS/YcfS/YnhG family)
MAWSAVLLLLCAWLGASGIASAWGAAEGCPAVLSEATRLVLVSTTSMNVARATLETFERDTPLAPWQRRSAAEPAVVGKAGLGWGLTYRHLAKPGEPLKQEGDKRAPAGIFGIGATFGFARSDRADHVQLQNGVQICVDDPASPYYSQIVSRAEAGPSTKGEDMPSIPLYRRGLVVDYPTSREKKAGSCIFIHIWRGQGVGTVGCVAIPESTAASLQDWAGAGGAAVAILPSAARDHFGPCLPRE